MKPELVANGPSQVWSWDITKLRGPAKADWYHLYVLIDIYSRHVVGWTLAAREDSLPAEELIRTAIETNGVVPHTPASVHHGTAELVRQQRAITLAQAYADLT